MKPILLIAILPLAISLMNFGSSKSAGQSNPVVTVDPGKLDFGDQVVKKEAKPQRVTVTNTGAKNLYINSVVLSGDNRQDFGIAKDTCTGATIAPTKSCVVDVTFAPQATERRKATLTITDNALDSPQALSLTGVGINSVAVPPRSGGTQN